MNCPACKSDMIVVEYHDIELDYCPECRGVWFDSGELQLLLKLQESDEIEIFLENMKNNPDAVTTEKKRKCPICRRKMDKKDIGEKPIVMIDACGKGHGLWFDGGEIIELSNQLAGSEGGEAYSKNPAVKFLEEFFGTPE